MQDAEGLKDNVCLDTRGQRPQIMSSLTIDVLTRARAQSACSSSSSYAAFPPPLHLSPPLTLAVLETIPITETVHYIVFAIL